MDFSSFKTKRVEKGTILLYPGAISKAAFKVQKGCLKSYIIDDSGKEHILQFAPEDWFISDMESYTRKTPGKIYISAVEDSEIVLIDTAVFEYTVQLDMESQKVWSEKYRNSLIANQNRLISLLSYNAEQKYLQFMETYPGLAQRLPLKLIASYLGMTPEHLSFTRKQLAKKQSDVS